MLHSTAEDFLNLIDLPSEYPFPLEIEDYNNKQYQIIWDTNTNNDGGDNNDNNDNCNNNNERQRLLRRGSRLLFFKKNRGNNKIGINNNNSCSNMCIDDEYGEQEEQALTQARRYRHLLRRIRIRRRRGCRGTDAKKIRRIRIPRVRRPHVRKMLGKVRNTLSRNKNNQHYQHVTSAAMTTNTHASGSSSLTTGIVDALPSYSTSIATTNNPHYYYTDSSSSSSNTLVPPSEGMAAPPTPQQQMQQQQEPLSFSMTMRQIIPILSSVFHLIMRIFAPIVVVFTVSFLVLYIIASLLLNNTNKNQDNINNNKSRRQSSKVDSNNSYSSSSSTTRLVVDISRIVCSVLCLFNVMVMLTDEIYIIEYTRLHLVLLYCFCTLLVYVAASVAAPAGAPNNNNKKKKRRRQKQTINFIILPITIISILLVIVCHIDIPDPITYKPGLYYDTSNSFISNIVQQWPINKRMYDINDNDNDDNPTTTTSILLRKTPFLTGDTRTFVPWAVNANKIKRPNYVRRWVPSIDPNENEAVLLDIAFPNDNKHHKDKPLYFVLGGLHSGSDEKFVQDLIHRVTSTGSTVAVMTMRGLQDSPIVGDNIMHFARISDVESSLKAIQKAVGYNKDQTIIGVGYSMGGMILSNYVSRTCSSSDNNNNKDNNKCKLNAAISVSSVLDPGIQQQFHRSTWLWQKVLTHNFREKIMKSFTHQISKRLDRDDIMNIRLANNMKVLDETLFVKYFGFNDSSHYYDECGALSGFVGYGDEDDYTNSGSGGGHEANQDDDEEKRRYEEEEQKKSSLLLKKIRRKGSSWSSASSSSGGSGGVGVGRIGNVKIPLLSIFALDDPIAYYGGLGNPGKLCKAGRGNLLFLITRTGGHVGWPLGTNPAKYGWKWISDAISSFADSVHVVSTSTSTTASKQK